jgi:hypothetical protein
MKKIHPGLRKYSRKASKHQILEEHIMATAKITITGSPERGPKINSDGTVELIFKISMTAAVPKGLKCLGDSYYFVTIGKKSWKKISADAKKESFFIIQGEPKASVNKKGQPFISVIAFDISLKEDFAKKFTKEEPKIAESTVEVIEKPIVKPVEDLKPIADKKIDVKEDTKVYVTPNVNIQESPQNEKVAESPSADAEASTNKEKVNKVKKKKKKVKPWFEELRDELVEINVSDVILTDQAHLSAYNINVYGLDKVQERGSLNAPIAVNKLDDGTYSLVAGFKLYIQSKLLNFKTINAFITDLNHHDFVMKYHLQENQQEKES